MKRKRILKLLWATMLLAIAAAFVTACSKEEEEGVEYWSVTIEGHYAPYATNDKWGDWSMGLKSLYGMRDNGEHLLFSDGEIVGFSYEEGYVYELLIKATPTLQQIGTCNPPPYKFELVKMISKERMKIDDVI